MWLSFLANVASIGLAIAGIAAGWLHCVDEHPNDKRLVRHVPLVGKYLSRVRRTGWLLGLVIGLMSAISIFLGNPELSELVRKTDKVADIEWGEKANSWLLARAIARIQARVIGLWETCSETRSDLFQLTNATNAKEAA